MCEPLDYEEVEENFYAPAQDWVYFNAAVIEVSEQISEEDGKTYMMVLASVDDDLDNNWIYFIAEKQGNGMKANDKFTVYGQIQGVYI